jgi:hypothetical protein
VTAAVANIAVMKWLDDWRLTDDLKFYNPAFSLTAPFLQFTGVHDARTIDICIPSAYDTSTLTTGLPMRTTLDLNEKLIRELMDVTAAKTKTEAIHQAAAELIRRKKLDQLKSLSGTIHLDLNWKSLEQAEIRHQTVLKRRRHGHR